MGLTSELEPAESYRFGAFELNTRECELRKHGIRIRLQDQPLKVLVMLLAHPGDVVSRDDIQQRLWFQHFSVEFDHGINAAIRRLRTALGDSAEAPRYIETVPRRGYRFVAPVEAVKAATPPAPQSATPPVPKSPTRHDARKLALTALAFAIAVLAGVSLLLARLPHHPTAFDLQPPHDTILAGAPALSQDGSKLVAPVVDATGIRRLWVRRLDSLADTILSDTAGASRPFWSAEGQSIGYFAGNQLMRISLAGRSASRLIGSLGAAGGAWSQDNTVLYGSSRFGPLFRFNAYAEGIEGPVTRLGEGERFGHTSPRLLPDGRHFLFVAPNRDQDKSAVHLGEFGSFDRKLLMHDVSAIEFAPPDFLLFIRSGKILAQKFDFAKAQAIGEPKSVAGGGGSSGIADFSVSQQGALVYRRGARGTRADLVWRGEDGRLLGYAGESAPYWQVFLSPDGTRATVNTGENGSTLAVLQLANHTLTRLSSGPQPSPFTVLDGIWSPDSQSVAYQLYGRAKTQIFTRRPEDPAPKLLLDDGNSNYPDAWSPDGKWILGRRTGNIVIAIPTDGSASAKVLQDADYLMDQFAFSPDGKWVAYNADRSGQWEVYVARFPEMDRIRQVSMQGGCQPLWRNDGKELSI